MVFRCTILSLFLFSALSFGNREVRFWIGDKPESTSCQDHLEYIASALMPATIAAGHGGLIHYLVYIPSKKDVTKLSEPVHLDRLPISEAAMPTYADKEVYDEARKQRFEYGPLHSRGAGFDSKVSYSSVPQEFTQKDRDEGVHISQKEPRSDRIAYSLTPNTDNNWQEGTTTVWLLLRKKNIATPDYRKSVADMFQNIITSELPDMGPTDIYARVDEGFVMFFINHGPSLDKNGVADATKELQGKMADTLVEYEHVIATNQQILARGWYTDIVIPGNAINVMFVPGKREDLGLPPKKTGK